MAVSDQAPSPFRPGACGFELYNERLLVALRPTSDPPILCATLFPHWEEPIRDVLYSSTQGDSVEVDRRWVNVLSKEIQAVEVTMVAELARTNTTVEQLLAMKKGDFIELEREPRIQASIDGVPLFECQYGTHNAKYAVRIDKSLRGDDLGWMGERRGG